MQLIPIIRVAAILFLLGCVGGSANLDINADGNMDLNSFGSGNQWPDNDVPTDLDATLESDQKVTQETCTYFKSLAAYVDTVVEYQGEGASVEYKGLAEYRGAFWCKTSIYKKGDPNEFAIYQNPFTTTSWSVAMEDGHIMETHMWGTGFEIYYDGVLQPTYGSGFPTP